MGPPAVQLSSLPHQQGLLGRRHSEGTIGEHGRRHRDKEPTGAVAALDPSRKWSSVRRHDATIHHIGTLRCLSRLIEGLDREDTEWPNNAAELLRSERNQFGVIVESSDFLFAAVDRVRGYPIFYTTNPKGRLLANCARLVRRLAALEEIDELALLEFQMAGYVTGRETLYRDLYQLQSGELLYWQRNAPTPDIRRYYRYVPRPTVDKSREDLVEELGTAIDNSVHRAIEVADGAPIWVPLSGGLDSRLILAKLVEFGYEPLHAFSYGVRDNNEVTVARGMAKKLDVQWFQTPTKPRNARMLYQSDGRRNYAAFADGLCSVPKYLDFEAISRLTSDGTISPDSVIINGQSGDYLTGAHIPQVWSDGTAPSIEDLLRAIEKKHFSLWPQLNTPVNLEAIEAKILSLLPSSDLPPRDRLCAQYESWEWQERQSKAVVNAQRIYDHFGLRWTLPLWDGELMDFFEAVPFGEKFGQGLYIDYLRRYNFRGVFNTLRYTPNTWPPQRRWIQMVARALGLAFGKGAKESYYRRMSYYSVYQGQFALFGRDYYLAHYMQARGVTSFAVDHWLAENGLPRIVD